MVVTHTLSDGKEHSLDLRKGQGVQMRTPKFPHRMIVTGTIVSIDEGNRQVRVQGTGFDAKVPAHFILNIVQDITIEEAYENRDAKD